MTVLSVEHFEQMYADEDPFGYRSRWYEQRKRDILLGALPYARFARGWEFGCSNGELTAQLAPRCDTLLATDLSQQAVSFGERARAGAACGHAATGGAPVGLAGGSVRPDCLQ